MVRFVNIFVLFDLLVRCSASSTVYPIVLTASWKDKFVITRDMKNPSLLLNDPFKIHVYSDKPVKSIWCSNHKKDFTNAELSNYNNIYYTIADSVIATAEMNCTWRCNIYLLSDSTKAIQFDLHVGVRELDKNECSDNPCHELAFCINTVGSYQCKCLPGYEGNGFMCTDKNKCKPHSCHKFADCTNYDGSYLCSCLPGYEGDGIRCTDINECVYNPCHYNAHCTNTDGSYKCSCKSGFTGDGFTCTDVNECIVYKPCDYHANCTNTPGSFFCTCHQGFQSDSFKCQDIDECLTLNACGNNAICQNFRGGYSCECKPGYTGNPPDECVDVNECAGSTYVCKYRKTCENLVGTYKCSCLPGYKEDVNGDCQENAVEALPGPDSVRTPKKAPLHKENEPYIDVHIYRDTSGKLRSYTEAKLELDKPFKISVMFSDVDLAKPLTKIICFKSTRQSERYVNDPLVEEMKNIYSSAVATTTDSMNSNWTCEIHGTPPYIKIFWTFPVNFKKTYHRVPTPDTQTPSSDANKIKYADETTHVKKATTTTEEPQQNNGGEISPSINIFLHTDTNGNITSNVTSSPLSLHETFYININSVVPRNLTKIMCHNVDNQLQKYVDSVLSQDNNVYTVKIDRATKAMETDWKCKIDSLIVKFHVELKKTGDAGEVFVNNLRIRTKKYDNLNTGYNARAEYSYYEGELAKITCQKIEGNLMNITLLRYNGSDMKVITTQSQDLKEQTMHVKLTNKYKGSYLSCNVQTKIFPPSWFTVRLYFYMLSANNNNDLPTFQVNGLILAPVNISKMIEYVYEYYKGETLSITGLLDKQWKCAPSTNYVPEQLKTIGQDEHINVTATIDCEFYTECHKGDIVFRLELVPQYPANFNSHINSSSSTTRYNWGTNHPVISGLSLAQTQIKFQQSKTTYITKYKNTRHKNLHLNCISNSAACSWEFNTTEVISIPDDETFVFNTATSKFENKKMFGLIKTITSTVIKCKCNDAKSTETYTHLAEIMNEPTQTPEHAKSTTGGGGSSNLGWFLMLLGIIGVTLTVVILIVWIIVGIHKRKQRMEKEQASDVNYENLPNHNEGPMPMPHQWDTYSNPADAKDTHNMYSEPHVQKNLEAPNETLYAEVGGQASNELLYAEVGAHSDLNYADIEPEGGKIPKNEYANLKQNMPEYGQIQPKKWRDHARCAPQVLPMLINGDNYAQVVPKSLRKNPDATNYTNVFENQHYANAKAKDDYAEPAYCEVNPNHN